MEYYSTIIIVPDNCNSDKKNLIYAQLTFKRCKLENLEDLKGPYRILGVFWPTILLQWTHIFGKNFFLVHKNIFLSNFFIFDQKSPIFTLAVVAVFPKQVLPRQSTQKLGAQKQPPKDMRIRIPKFFSVLKNWRSKFFIFTPKRSYKFEILNMAENVLKSGMALCYLILFRSKYLSYW